jgi:predicted PhzF superfamily epimerase YddE/YHI9
MLMKSASDQETLSQGGGIDRQLMAAFVLPAKDSLQQSAHGGNPCLLLMFENAPSAPAPTESGLTICQSWPAAEGEQPVIEIRCYTPDGHAIQCCGHGLLAAAYHWQQRLQCGELPLRMNSSAVPSWSEQGQTWLRFERLPTLACPVPAWVGEVFPGTSQPVSAATCGDEQGYLVLQWADGFSLEALPSPHDRFSALSRRALICTSAQPSVGADAIQLRYFAPQYGVAEDAATGSAVRVLADYWSPRFASLTAQQCSPEGGRLLARIATDHVEVGGRCIPLQMTTSHD